VLKDSQDAYGHQQYDFYKSRQVVEIVERDDGLIDPSETYPKYYLSEYKDWSLRERQAARYVKGRVLDIGCGGVEDGLSISRRKATMSRGFDSSPLAVKVCKLRGLFNVRVKSITEVDSKLGRFDTILMIGNHIGFFGGPKRARQSLKRFHRMTSPGALIIAESLVHLQAAHGPGPQTVSSAKS